MRPARSWHRSNWGVPGLIETFIKILAILVGITSAVAAVDRGDFALPQGLRLLQWALMLLLSLGLLAAILERYNSRESFSMIFVILNNMGHWGMLLAMTTLTGPGELLLLYATLMLMGDLVKLWAIALTDFPVKTVSQRILLGLTGFYAFAYLMIAILGLFQP